MLKQFITLLLASVTLILLNTSVEACDLDPTAVIDILPDEVVFLVGDSIYMEAYNSSPNCGYISGYRWRVDGVTESTSGYFIPNLTLQSGEDSRSFDIQLRVQNSVGNYDHKTVAITIVREHSSYYYLTDHLGSVRVTVDDDGNSVGGDDYYPFGLQMPGRTQNASNPNDDAKFTGYLLEQDGDLGLYHAEARMYDPVIGRFMQVDPMSNLYPSSGPYTYALNNPLIYIDPTGETVECSDRADCQQAADDINELHDGADVEVLEKTRAKRFLGVKYGEETYYELSTGVEDYDWSEGGENKYGLALYDVLASEENVFEVTYSEQIGYNSDSYNKTDGQTWGGGKFDPNWNRRGGDIQIDPRGYQRVGEPSSVVLMHELVGHTHPVAEPSSRFDQNAHDINRFYHPRVGINNWVNYRNPHQGYTGDVSWVNVNLFKN